MGVNFTDNSKEALRDKDMAIKRALIKCGMLMEANAKINLETDPRRVDTGRLRNSITYATSEYSGVGSYSDNEGNSYSDASAINSPHEEEVYVGTNVEYAEYVHEGTFRMVVPNAFLKNAIAEHIDEYQSIIEEELKD